MATATGNSQLISRFKRLSHTTSKTIFNSVDQWVAANRHQHQLRRFNLNSSRR
jgi:hypothetical protein